jgi:hypothetical protein
MQRKPVLAAALAASLLGLAGAAQATPAVVAPSGSYYSNTTVYPAAGVIVQSAPPAPIYEAVPAPRAGLVWAPGHFVWSNGTYLWRPGEWVAARPGFYWETARWEQRSDGSWYLVGGNWVQSESQARGPGRDRDGDGIRNRDDNDRDGDGVANWEDRYPNDYYRW